MALGHERSDMMNLLEHLIKENDVMESVNVEIQPTISDPPAAQNLKLDNTEPSLDREGNGNLQDPDDMPDDKKRADLAKEVDESFSDKHRIKIAKDTLKMSDAGARISGGMTKEEARKFLKSIGWSDSKIASLEEKKISDSDVGTGGKRRHTDPGTYLVLGFKGEKEKVSADSIVDAKKKVKFRVSSVKKVNIDEGYGVERVKMTPEEIKTIQALALKHWGKQVPFPASKIKIGKGKYYVEYSTGTGHLAQGFKVFQDAEGNWSYGEEYRTTEKDRERHREEMARYKKNKRTVDSVEEAKMSVDYMKSITSAVKRAKEALKNKDYEGAKAALEDVADDATDAAKATTKIAREEEVKVEKEKSDVSESDVSETEGISKLYSDAGLPAPEGKGVHTKAFHELAVKIAKGYVDGGDSPSEALEKAYPTAMKQLGKGKAVKADHRKDESLTEDEEDTTSYGKAGYNWDSLTFEELIQYVDQIKDLTDPIRQEEEHRGRDTEDMLTELEGRVEALHNEVNMHLEKTNKFLSDSKDKGVYENIEPYFLCQECGKVYDNKVEECVCNSKLIECIQISNNDVKEEIDQSIPFGFRKFVECYVLRTKEKWSKEDIDEVLSSFQEILHGEAKRQGVLEDWIEKDDSAPKVDEEVEGSDEFVVLARGMDKETAERMAREKEGEVSPDEESETENQFKVMIKKEI